MRLNFLSFHELLKNVNTKIAKRNVNMGKQSLPVSVYPLRYSL